MEIQRTLETRIRDHALCVRFDGGTWLVVDLGVEEVIKLEDLGENPRAGSVTYRNMWGLTRTESFYLRAPMRLG